jgi:hypothetical protein
MKIWVIEFRSGRGRWNPHFAEKTFAAQKPATDYVSTLNDCATCPSDNRQYRARPYVSDPKGGRDG